MINRNLALASTLATTAILVVLGHGCTAILDIPEEVTGYSWCLDAEPATGRRSDNLNLVGITYAVSDNWTRGCKCYCLADHQIMLEGAAGELLVTCGGVTSHYELVPPTPSSSGSHAVASASAPAVALVNEDDVRGCLLDPRGV